MKSCMIRLSKDNYVYTFKNYINTFLPNGVGAPKPKRFLHQNKFFSNFHQSVANISVLTSMKRVGNKTGSGQVVMPFVVFSEEAKGSKLKNLIFL